MARTTKLQPIGRLYLVESAFREGTYFAESDILTRGKDQTEADGVAALMQQDDALTVWELNPSEGTMRDVSEDMARKWLGQYEGEQDDLPRFITSHLTDSEIDEHFAQAEHDARYCRELASPEATGRI